jgi:hypothetical protein
MPIFCETSVTPGSRSFSYVFLVEKLVDRDRGVVAVRHRPDDVLRPERGVAAEEDVRDARLESHLVEGGETPFVKSNA